MQIHTETESFTVSELSRRHHVPRSEVITAARNLEARGKGRFVVGRKGHPSRFIAIKEAPTTRTPAWSQGHVVCVAVRPDVVITLPADLTDTEKATFLRVLQAIWGLDATPATT